MKYSLIYTILLLGGLLEGPSPAPVKWVVTAGCSLQVEGSTNVNKFSCFIANYAQPDTIVVTRTTAEAVLLDGQIRPEVLQFDCHIRAMTDDLRKTLKAKQFPRMVIRFLSLSQYPEGKLRQKTLTGQVLIELAGITHRYEVIYNVLAAEADKIHLIGTRKVKFTDFNIDPPRKLGGLIKTENELNVTFSLKVKVLN